MKRITTVLLIIIILCGVFIYPVGANTDTKENYIGTYVVPAEYGRPWFGYKLTIFDINDEYVDYDFEVKNAGHAREYIEDRAYFVNEYTAEGTGRVGYADETIRYEIVYKLTFYNDRIHLYTSGLFGDGIDFYITPKGEFSREHFKDNSYVSYSAINDTYIDVTNKVLRIINLSDYSTSIISNNASWNFISDGEYLYYIENQDTVKRINLYTFQDEALFNANGAFLIDCLSNKYILYEYHPNEDSEDVFCNVYNADSQQHYYISNYSSAIGFTSSGRVIYMDLQGQVAPGNLYASNIDGSYKTLITDEALAYSVCIDGENLYYADAVTDSLTDIRFHIKMCDSYGNNVTILTDELNNKSDIDVTNRYVEFVPYEKIFKSNGGYDIEYGTKERLYYNNYKSAEKQMYPNTQPPVSIRVTLNGEEIPFDQPPIMYNDRTLVPLRAICEVLGATVYWNDDTQTVTAEKGDITIKFTIGAYEFYKNGFSILLDVPGMIVNGRTLVPIRAISEALNCTVEWDDRTEKVYILYNGYPSMSNKVQL